MTRVVNTRILEAVKWALVAEWRLAKLSHMAWQTCAMQREAPVLKIRVLVLASLYAALALIALAIGKPEPVEADNQGDLANSPDRVVSASAPSTLPHPHVAMRCQGDSPPDACRATPRATAAVPATVDRLR